MGARPNPITAESTLVPPWLQEAATDPSGPIDRGPTLALLDEHLCRLSWLEHVPLYVRCVLAGRIARRTAHEAASCATLRDFAREHGGVSPRTFYAMARVGTLAEGFPEIGEAFFAGEIQYSQMITLARIVDADNAVHWLSVARSTTVKELEARVRDARAASGRASPTGQNDPLYVMECDRGAPRSVLVLLAWCQDLLRKMLGRPVGQATVLKYAAAEWLSGPGIPGGGQTPHHWSVDPYAPVERGGGRGPTDASVEWEVCDLLEDLDRRVDVSMLPLRFAALLDGLDQADDRTLVERFIEAGAWSAPIEMALGRLLSPFRTLRLARHTEHRTFDRYAKERLGMSASRARLLARVDEAFRDHDDILAAWAAGELNALRLDLIRKVATEATAPAWGRRARTDVTMLKRLQQEVDWALVECDLRETGGIDPPPLGETLPFVDQQISAHAGLPESVIPVAPIRLVLPEGDAHLVITALQSATREGEPGIVALVRILFHAAQVWSRQPSHRNKTFARDGFWCGHPGCTESRDLHSHHIHFRSRGGNDRASNRVTLCHIDHQINIHGTGRTRVWRGSDGVLRWEIGRAGSKPPLVTLRGEIVVSRFR